MTISTGARLRLFGAGTAALAASLAMPVASAETNPAATPTAVDPQVQSQTQGIAEGSDIVVTATRANEIAPVTASL